MYFSLGYGKMGIIVTSLVEVIRSSVVTPSSISTPPGGAIIAPSTVVAPQGINVSFGAI